MDLIIVTTESGAVYTIHASEETGGQICRCGEDYQGLRAGPEWRSFASVYICEGEPMTIVWTDDTELLPDTDDPNAVPITRTSPVMRIEHETIDENDPDRLQ